MTLLARTALALVILSMVPLSMALEAFDRAHAAEDRARDAPALEQQAHPTSSTAPRADGHVVRREVGPGALPDVGNGTRRGS